MARCFLDDVFITICFLGLCEHESTICFPLKRLFENSRPRSRRREEADSFLEIPRANSPPHVGGYTFHTGSKSKTKHFALFLRFGFVTLSLIGQAHTRARLEFR